MEAVPLLVILAALPIGVLALRWGIFLHARLRGRYVPWAEVERALRSGSGTFVICEAGWRLGAWWCPDRIDEDDFVLTDLDSAYMTWRPWRYQRIERIQTDFPAANAFYMGQPF